MDSTEVLDIGREAVFLLLKVSAPIMFTALGIGLTIALFQALTQIQEMTLTFVPKIIGTFLVLVFLLPFIASNLGGFAEGLYRQIGQM